MTTRSSTPAHARVARQLASTIATLFAFGGVSASAQNPAPATAQPPTAAATSKTAADIPVADFFRLPRYSQMALSPDGKRLAALAPVNGRDNLIVISLSDWATLVVTNFDYVDVSDFLWLNDERLFFSTQNQLLESGADDHYEGYFAVDLNGFMVRNLAPDRRDLQVYGVAKDGSGDLIAGWRSDHNVSENVFRINTRTGRRTTLTFHNPGNVTWWATDRTGAIRGALRHEPRQSSELERGFSLWLRNDGDGPWQRSGEISDAANAVRPLAFESDNSLIVATRAGRDRMALYRYNIAEGKLGEKLFEHSWLDISRGLIVHPRTKALLGVRFSAEMPTTHWFDRTYRELQSEIDRALSKTVNTITPGDDADAMLLVFAASAQDAGAYYLYNKEKRTLERIASTREWLNPALMAERRFAPYKARDGATIPAWLTLPRGVNPRALPLIVHVHGGPQARSYHGIQWGYRPVAQFLASRGYAVLEPEPRGSTGFGLKHYELGFKQWGLAMQDDITDGALHLASEGIVNRDRMCLFGGSYGGYAALQGVVKDPDLWRCANAYVAVTDLELMQTVPWSDIATKSDYLTTDFKRVVGDREKDRAQFDATSPAKNAAKIKAAVMLTMGGDDLRVPLIHGTTMRDAMRKAGKHIDYHVYVNESHGFNAPENVIDFYTRTEAFFAKHLK